MHGLSLVENLAVTAVSTIMLIGFAALCKWVKDKITKNDKDDPDKE